MNKISMSNAATIKRMAQNVATIVKNKNKVKAKIDALQAEYDSLVEQQEMFEAPVRQITGGYSTEDLIKTEVVESGVDKNGKPIRSTRYSFRYPDTILPPEETAAPEAQAEATEPADETAAPEAEIPSAAAPSAVDDLPFGE